MIIEQCCFANICEDIAACRHLKNHYEGALCIAGRFLHYEMKIPLRCANTRAGHGVLINLPSHQYPYFTILFYGKNEVTPKS